MKKIKLSTKGFTLLETLLVLAVIVLVTAVTLLSINQAKTKAIAGPTTISSIS